MVQFNTNNRKTGSVMIFVQKKIKFMVITNNNINKNAWINTIQLKNKYKGIIICNVCHAPSKSDGTFIEEIINECEKIVHIGNWRLI